MNLDLRTLAINGPLLITPKRRSDVRGFFSETYNARDFAAAGITDVFTQDNLSRSIERGTVRGLHFQAPPHAQTKLVRVARGAILDVVVDLRKGSSSYGSAVAVELNAETGAQLYVPKGFAHGYCTLDTGSEVSYKVSAPYEPQCEGGIVWNDPALAIAWPVFAGAVISERDSTLPLFAALDSPFSMMAAER